MIKRLHLFLTEFFDKLDVKRSGYKVNKLITRTAFVLCLLYLLFVGSVDGFGAMVGSSWVECPVDAVTHCLNPLYRPSCQWLSDDCESLYLLRGEVVGVKPSVYARSFNSVIFGVLGFAFLLNHFLYNRSFRVNKN